MSTLQVMNRRYDYRIGGGLPLDEDWEKESNFESALATKIHIGNFEVKHNDLSRKPNERVFFRKDQIQFEVTAVMKETQVEAEWLQIKVGDMESITCHFGDSVPGSVMMVLMKPSPAEEIKKKLGMTEESKFNFDPLSSDLTVKYIILKLENLNGSMADVILRCFDINIIQIVDRETMNNLLIETLSEGEERGYPSQTLLIYPPPPARGGITITTKDYYCLEEGQFLNDVILDFYLKYLVLEKLSKEDKERTHLFSTFFYKRLTSKPKMGKNVVEDNRVMSPAEIRHARVKSWTKNVDIFKKDFIIIPINERSHWFLAVICFPRLISSTPVTIIGNSASADINKKLPTNKQNKTEIPIVEDTEWSDKDEAESEEENLIVETEEVSQIKKPRMENDPEVSELSHKVQFSAQPCILIFDSLAGGSRSRIVATLRDYLSVEYFEKKQIRKIFSKDLIKGACLNVPQQTNFTDCGIFTLQFAESFFETPLKTFKFPIPSLTNWFTQDCVSCKREQIARKIEKLMNEFKPHHGIKLMKIIFKSSEEVDNKSPKIEKKVTERHEIICELKNKKSKVAKNADSAKSKKLHTPEDDTYKEIIIEDIRSVSVIHTQPRIPKRPLTPGPYRKPEPKYQTPLVGLYGEKLSTLQRSIAAKSISITDVNQSSNSYTPNKILKQQFASTSSHFSKPKSLKGGESNWKSKSSSLEGGGTKSKAEEEEDVIFENEILMPKLGYRHFPQKQSVAAVKGVDLKDKSLSTTNIVINNCQGNQHQTPNRSVLVKTKPSEYDYHY